jgi:hypothetical protein
VSLARRAILVLGVLGTGAASATAQQGGMPPGAEAPRIALITVGPGAAVWEKFGHNMIRVTDPSNGTDLAYNFGIFDFNQKNFYWNFLQGRMLYAMDSGSAPWELMSYGSTGRSIEIQDLALAPEQARLLAANLARNAEPDRRNYRYDYYLDNCSTRVRDALDVALGGALKRQLAGVATSATFRSRTAELTAGNPAVYFGLMLLLGPSTDRPLTAWEDSFIPMNLAHYIEPVVNPALEGGAQPLVAAGSMRPATDAMAPSTRTPASWTGWFLVLGVAVGGLLAWSGAWSAAGRGRTPLLVLGGLWTLVAGIAGVVMLYLWAFTDHAVAYRNVNILQADALGLVMFGLLAGWARRSGPPPAGLRAVALAVAALSVFGLALHLLPWSGQANGVILCFFVPANLGMALGARRAATAATTAPTAVPPAPPRSSARP